MDNIEDLLLRYCDGSSSAEESSQVEQWLGASEDNRKIYKQLQVLGLASDVAGLRKRLDEDQALASVRGRMRRGGLGPIFRKIQQIAAILAIPLAVGCYLLYSQSDGERMILAQTNPGMTTTITLPDSSTVTLNSLSSLEYPSKFSRKSREVRLSGEAYFSVTKDPRRKFVVNAAHGTQVVVHGTEFDLNAYPEDSTVQATLVSGKVRFAWGNKHVEMRPGQKAVYNPGQGKLMLRSAKVDVETGWKDGRLVFRDTPFEEVLNALGKRYNVRFVLKNQSLKRYSFTATFTHQRLERILEHFRIASGINFRTLDEKNAEVEKQLIEIY